MRSRDETLRAALEHAKRCDSPEMRKLLLQLEQLNDQSDMAVKESNEALTYKLMGKEFNLIQQIIDLGVELEKTHPTLPPEE